MGNIRHTKNVQEIPLLEESTMQMSSRYYDSTKPNGVNISDVGMNDGEVIPGRYYEHDGVDDHTVIADDNSLSFGDTSTDSVMSGCAWVKMNDATNFRILAKEDNVNFEYIFAITGSDFLTCGIYDNDSGNRIKRNSTTTLTINEGSWTHLAFSYDGSGISTGIKLYVNGVEITASDDNAGSYTAMHNTTADLLVGKNGASTVFSNGGMRDIRIIAEEITDWTSIMGGAINGNEVLHLKCEEGGGLVAFDSSGNLNHGDITNTTLSTFHSTDTGILYSFANEEGYTECFTNFMGKHDSLPAGVTYDGTKYSIDTTGFGGSTSFTFTIPLVQNQLFTTHMVVDNFVSGAGYQPRYYNIKGFHFYFANAPLSDGDNVVATTNFGTGFDPTPSTSRMEWLIPANTVLDITDWFIEETGIYPKDNSTKNKTIVYSDATQSGSVSRLLTANGKVRIKTTQEGANGLDFNGVDQSTLIPHDPSLHFNNGSNDLPFSISGWCNIDSLSSFFTIFGKPGFEYVLGVLSNGKVGIYCYTIGNYISRQTIDISSYIGQDIFIVSTYDGSEVVGGLSVYVYDNAGSLIATDSADSIFGSYAGMTDAMQDQSIGLWDGNDADGKIWDVRVYNKELSVGEIDKIKLGERNGSEVLHIPCSEGIGSIVHDVSGNGNHGTIQNYVGSMWTTQDVYHFNHSEGYSTILDPVKESADGIGDYGASGSITLSAESGGVIRNSFNINDPSASMRLNQDWVNNGTNMFESKMIGQTIRMTIEATAITGSFSSIQGFLFSDNSTSVSTTNLVVGVPQVIETTVTNNDKVFPISIIMTGGLMGDVADFNFTLEVLNTVPLVDTQTDAAGNDSTTVEVNLGAKYTRGINNSESKTKFPEIPSIYATEIDPTVAYNKEELTALINNLNIFADRSDNYLSRMLLYRFNFHEFDSNLISQALGYTKNPVLPPNSKILAFIKTNIDPNLGDTFDCRASFWTQQTDTVFIFPSGLRIDIPNNSDTPKTIYGPNLEVDAGFDGTDKWVAIVTTHPINNQILLFFCNDDKVKEIYIGTDVVPVSTLGTWNWSQNPNLQKIVFPVGYPFYGGAGNDDLSLFITDCDIRSGADTFGKLDFRADFLNLENNPNMKSFALFPGSEINQRLWLNNCGLVGTLDLSYISFRDDREFFGLETADNTLLTELLLPDDFNYKTNLSGILDVRNCSITNNFLSNLTGDLDWLRTAYLLDNGGSFPIDDVLESLSIRTENKGTNNLSYTGDILAGGTNPAATRDIIHAEIVAAGTGYVVSDTISPTDGGGASCVITVDSIGGSGEVTGISITNGGSGYTSEPTTFSTSGSGVGADLELLTAILKLEHANYGNFNSVTAN